MTTVFEEYRRKIEVEHKDYFYAKSREIIREKGGMITTDEAYKLAVQKHLPKMVRAQRDEYFRQGNFKMYELYDHLFFAKDPAIREAATKELDDLIAQAENKQQQQFSK